jgi:NAD(P)-dependent dehydrogenase (short-subunit alcohol dehydrogenase family)
MTDALRRELRGQGVDVVAIEPGAIATPIWGKGMSAADAHVAGMTDEQRRRYGGVIAAVRREAERAQVEGLDPEEVAAVVATALTTRRPRTRYVIGREARIQAVLARVLPDRALDALIGRVLR